MENIQHKNLCVNGINMHIAEIGEGPSTILFLHGFPELWYTWRHQLISLSSKGYRAIAPDLRGYGDTDAPTSPSSYTIFHIVGDLIALLDALGIDQVHQQYYSSMDSLNYTWHHQLISLSSKGYSAIAPDLRGYGDTDAPPSLSSYTIFHIVGDLIALLDALGLDQVFLVGHDWGAVIAWHVCLLRPDRIKALVNMSVVFHARNPKRKPIESMRAVLGDDYYICRFQECGEVEEEFARVDTARLIAKFLTSRSPVPLRVPKEKGFGGSPHTPITLPSWLLEEDLNYYANKFRQSGFTGGLNYYRAMDLNWELTAPWTGVQIKVPVKFIVGDLDLTYNTPGVKEYIHKGGFQKMVPFLQEVVIMEGVAHFINQEKPEEINDHIYDFFQKF